MAQSALQKSASARPLSMTVNIVCTLLAVAALVALSLFVRANPQWPVDLQTTRDVESINAPWFNAIMHTVGLPGYPPQVYVVLVLLLGILWAFKLKWEAVMELYAIVGIGIGGLLIKLFVDRARPPVELLNGGTVLDNGKNSFPAGHVESYVAIFGFLIYLSYTLLPKNSVTRWLSLIVYGLMIAFIGISRVYLGEHWLTDVIGGYLFGAIWLWLTIQLYQWGKPRFFTKERDQADGKR